MGAAISHCNNRLSFDFAEYVREREELSKRFREIIAASEQHRSQRKQFQGTTSAVTAGVGCVVALVAAPATFGLSLVPAAAATTVSAAAYGHGFVVNKDIVRQLENLQFMIDSISRKDKEVNSLLVKSLKDDDEEEDDDKHKKNADSKSTTVSPVRLTGK